MFLGDEDFYEIFMKLGSVLTNKRNVQSTVRIDLEDSIVKIDFIILLGFYI